MPRLLAIPDRQRLEIVGRPVGVDRPARLIRGMVVAQLGPFRSEGRGEFDEASLRSVVDLWPKNGLRSRFSHPNESSDGLGKHLGRAHGPYLSTALVDRDGAQVEVKAVRADLHLHASAFEGNPNGNIGDYVLSLAADDPGAISSSLVLRTDQEYRLETDGTPKRGPDGKPLPPLWRPTKLFATDVVDEGDAVDSILGVSHADVQSLRWTRDYLSTGESLLNKLFAGQPLRVTRARLTSYLNRYLARRYGGESMQTEYLGASLAGVLEMYIAEKAGDDPNAKIGIFSQLADASGKSVDEVIAIVNGEAEPDLPCLEAFATVLECPLSELVAAAEEDGTTFGGEQPAEGEGDAPADTPADGGGMGEPAPAVGMSSKPGVLRRRLDLKTKVGG